MSRKIRQPQKIFKVFCEGGTEHHYIDELRRQKKLSITLKLVNMEGGGYRNFLEQVRTDGTANCLAKFIIIDGDRAISEEGEKKNLGELLKYCIRQNIMVRTPRSICSGNWATKASMLLRQTKKFIMSLTPTETLMSRCFHN